MRNRTITNRGILGLDPATPEPVPIHHRPVPSPVQSWTLDVECSEFADTHHALVAPKPSEGGSRTTVSEFIQIHTVAITRRTRILVRRFNLLTVLTLLTLAASGCQSLTYTGPTGEHFTRRSFGSKTAISSLTVETGTNGVRKIDLRGYTNDQTQALGAVTEAAVRAALQTPKP